MNSKERFLKALNLEIPDRVPFFDYLFNKDLFRNTLSVEPVENSVKRNYAVSLILGLDSLYVDYGASRDYKKEYVEKDIYLNEWGAAVKEDPSAWPWPFTVKFVVDDEEELKRLKIPDPDRSERYDEIRQVIELNRDRIALGGGVVGPLSVSWQLMKPEKIMWYLYDKPKLIKDLFRIAADFNIAVGLNEIKAGVDHIWISEDVASTQNTYFSRKVLMEIVYPFLEEMVTEFRRARKDIPIIFHCCGNFKLFIEDFISLGIQAIHPFQRAAGWDLKETKEKYGKRVCLITGIDQTYVLPIKNPEEIEKECKEIIGICKEGGGYVFSSDHSLHEGIPFENVMAMVRAVEKYGYY